MNGHEEPGITTLTKDYAPGIEAARRTSLASTRPGNDFAHLKRFLRSELLNHLVKTTLVAQEGVTTQVTVRTYLDVTLRMFDATRTLATVDIFTVVWSAWVNTVKYDWGEQSAREYLTHHGQHHRAADVRKLFNIPTQSLDDDLLIMAPHWCAFVGTPRGVASGTQAVEAFHSPWEKEMKILGVAATPHAALSLMQELFLTWSCELPYDSPHNLCLHCADINPDLLHNAELIKIGSNPAYHYYQNRANGNFVKLTDEDHGAIVGVASSADCNVNKEDAEFVYSCIFMGVQQITDAFKMKGIIQVDGKKSRLPEYSPVQEMFH